MAHYIHQMETIILKPLQHRGHDLWEKESIDS
jgi:hypothetical protein